MYLCLSCTPIFLLCSSPALYAAQGLLHHSHSPAVCFTVWSRFVDYNMSWKQHKSSHSISTEKHSTALLKYRFGKWADIYPSETKWSIHPIDLMKSTAGRNMFPVSSILFHATSLDCLLSTGLSTGSTCNFVKKSASTCFKLHILEWENTRKSSLPM